MIEKMIQENDKDGDGALSFSEARNICFMYAKFIDQIEISKKWKKMNQTSVQKFSPFFQEIFNKKYKNFQ